MPAHAPQAISFTDLDDENNRLQGKLIIKGAIDESDVTKYVLYWGTENATKIDNTPIVTYEQTGSDITHTFGEPTLVPSDAKRFLVYSANDDGEREPATSIRI